MLNTNLLWAKTISPTGKIVREETFLGAALAFIGIVILACAAVALVLYLAQ